MNIKQLIHIYVLLQFLFQAYSQSAKNESVILPQSHKPDIGVEFVAATESQAARLIRDPNSTSVLYYLRLNGDIYKVDIYNGLNKKIASVNDHALAQTMGLTISLEGNFFISGNVTQGNLTSAVIKKGVYLNASWTWTTVMQTEPYPL